MPRQTRGFYLQENQGWEWGFISAWRNYNHANHLIGFPHTTVIYWDLQLPKPDIAHIYQSVIALICCLLFTKNSFYQPLN